MGDRRRQECNKYRETGFCRFGNRCKFTHIIDKPNVVQELFSHLDINKSPSSDVRVGVDTDRAKQLREFLKSYIPNEKRGVIKDDETCERRIFISKETDEEEKNREAERLLEEKYQHIPDSEFKRKFLKNIIGNFRANKGHTSAVECCLERNPQLDLKLKNELTDKMNRCANYRKLLEFRKTLPVFENKQNILDIINENQVVVISGETGSGKTTQISQFILDEYIMNNRGSMCHIVCTQPRRISAVSVAQRVADERSEDCGQSVGYQIRLEKNLPRKQGSIIFCTTGILLQWLQSDTGLTHVSHVIIDEIHERNVDSDFVITVLREVLPQRRDLKVILMSATLNADQFSLYFSNCPSIHIPGKLYPVAKFYLEDVYAFTGYVKKDFRRRAPPRRNDANLGKFYDLIVPYAESMRYKYGEVVINQILSPDSEVTDLHLIQSLIEYICIEKGPGAILVFLPGWDTISKLCGMLGNSDFFSATGLPPLQDDDYGDDDIENDEDAEKHEIKILTGLRGLQFLILPLHSKIPTVNQAQVFDTPPNGVRKIIVSTNIAETSITINDVCFIIDSGKMKVKSYDVEKNISVLQDEWVTQANAQQRCGRAGRVQSGECYYLFTKARETLLEKFPKPEILRTRLEELILTIKLLQLGKVGTILNRVMDSPDPKTVNSSLKLLETLRALDSEENLTPLGYHLAYLPLEPNIAKMIILGAIFSCVDPILSLAACLSFKEPFVTPMGREKEVMDKKIFISKGHKSDHLVLAEGFQLWESCHNNKKARKMCRSNFLSITTLRNLKELKAEFTGYLHEMGFLNSRNTKDQNANFNSQNYSVLKAVICAGLYPNVAIVQRVQKYILSGKTEILVKTPEDGDVKFHRSSINSSQEKFESPYFVYHNKLKSSHIFLHDSTMISSLPLIFFSHKTRYDPLLKQIKVNNEIIFNCEKNLADLIQEMRQEVQKVLDTLILRPGVVDWASDLQNTKILRTAADLIKAEDEKISGVASISTTEVFIP